MSEALALFGDISNNKCFADSSMIIFLNKRDLFEEKIKRVGIETVEEFNDYAGKPGDYDDGCNYFAQKFIQQCKDPDKQIVTHFTCATDSENVRVVFNSCKQSILMRNMRESGFYSPKTP
jgi:hypothetical protein